MAAMTAPDATLQDDARYRALQAKDARFDGCFFTGVTSTGIYCRPVCRVRTPRRENCRFFSHAAQAEQAGFRPCLRCRPELAPRAGTGQPTPQDGVWSIQDASRLLALQAARLLDSPEAWPDSAPSVQSLATRLGISARHLRRIFEAQWGVAPLHYLQTRRLLCAKQLLTDTTLAVSQVAALSGFASTRRFNAVFSAHYALAPTQLRRGSAPNRRPLAPGIHLQLAYRPPYDVAAMLQFFASRQIAGLEIVNPNGERPFIGKTLTVTAAQQQHNGWLLARFDPQRHRVELQVSDSLQAVLPVVLARVRALLDLDADPQAINALLDPHFPLGGGLRVPGTLDGFELAVRAVLGQQITVAAARTLAERLVARFGQPLTSPVAGLDRLFPTPAALASASADALGQLGIVKQRQAAIQAIARALTQQQLFLHAGADVAATVSALTALPGIGDWTAQYIAMRALRWPDAFPAGDVALHKALGLQDTKRPAQAAQAAALAWQPWRSYAVIRAWALLPEAVKKRQVTQHATK
jgi:AraC family transcriptional regulator of adaptative response / DNA-3-methyladenine glycosylase II